MSDATQVLKVLIELGVVGEDQVAAASARLAELAAQADLVEQAGLGQGASPPVSAPVAPSPVPPAAAESPVQEPGSRAAMVRPVPKVTVPEPVPEGEPAKSDLKPVASAGSETAGRREDVSPVRAPEPAASPSRDGFDLGVMPSGTRPEPEPFRQLLADLEGNNRQIIAMLTALQEQTRAQKEALTQVFSQINQLGAQNAGSQNVQVSG